MKRAEFLAPARLEYLHEVQYHRTIERELARRFIADVESVVATALAFPNAGSPHFEGTYRLLLRDFPFSVIYQVKAGGILIVALAHHRRPPGYWLSRLNA